LFCRLFFKAWLSFSLQKLEEHSIIFGSKMLQGKKILLGITGSIAAYKSALLVRNLVKSGAEVKVLMTPAAKDFIAPLTLSTLSKNPVLSELFSENSWSNHVMLGRWADMMLIAPLSCNTLAKMANGQCDNLLLAVYLSATCPVVAAPAMDEDMWKHPTTQQNLDTLKTFGVRVIPVESGELASGLVGEGRMAEPETIVDYLLTEFTQTKDLEGKYAVITGGPTYETIDPVRFVGNHSSGKMGVALAKEMHRRGAVVSLILGPTATSFDLNGIKVQRVQTAEEMYEKCNEQFDKADITIMAAAVADYTPVEKSLEKIKKTEDHWILEFRKTKDILQSLGKRKRKDQLLVGFALETNNEKSNALEKLRTKNADIIVLNSLNDSGAGFGYNTNKVTIYDKAGNEYHFETKEKKDVAKDIVDTIIRVMHA
jgi:phosphopantothenoylcysteine decarboxylase / phosphopantothenate---cysteine ligase